MPGLTERRKLRVSSWLCSRAVVINIFRIFGVLVLLWGELGIYHWKISSCKWPDSGLSSSSHITHVLLVSDTQVQRPSIFRDEHSWSGILKQLIYDVNLKKSWHATKRLQPKVVFFLGDLLASGRTATSETEYIQYMEKFIHSFPIDSDTLAYYTPGNEDVGMGLARPTVNVRQLFSDRFGPFNQEVKIHNHTFVLLDAPGLVDEDYQRSSVGTGYNELNAVRGGAVDFVKKLVPGQDPVILLSHIPLYRKGSASCGPLREKGNIHKGVGHGYQNMLGKETTQFLLDTIHPTMIFSGDNRDYCALEINTPEVTVPEITIKSFSKIRHIKHPGFQLLSLGDTLHSQKSFATQPCLLPGNGKLYPVSVCLTLLLLLGFNVYRSRQTRRFFIPPMPLTTSRSFSNKLSSPTRSDLDSPIWTGGSAAVRTPNNASSRPIVFRSASRPATPLASSVLPVSTPLYHEEEENDDMYPAQYAQRMGYPDGSQDTWSPDHEDLDHVPDDNWHEKPSFAMNWMQASRWRWTRSLSIGGRRITIRIPSPSWSAFRDLVGLLGDRAGEDATFRRRGLIRSTLIDIASVGWTSLVAWLIFLWWWY
ncbi:hypothetical protein D9758_001955 [Tetrapyrgos nigripes]|uniref:Calcineurin-like phosphoesterase domain-containing protein n=1 Tax=Tetrapyrgos nigripes TaxID=182062 RepID=A0A8H5GTL6_9AGAR|nr:hypothetical protein D9758_001955 [Tetrapyrgos nigripes]